MTYPHLVHHPIRVVDPRQSIHLVCAEGVRLTPSRPRRPYSRARRYYDGPLSFLVATAAVCAPTIWVGHFVFEWIRVH